MHAANYQATKRHQQCEITIVENQLPESKAAFCHGGCLRYAQPRYMLALAPAMFFQVREISGTLFVARLQLRPLPGP